VSRAEGKHVTTIEGLSSNLSHPLQKAWIELDVPQCGYCQSGQIMSAAVLLAEIHKPTDKDIDEAMAATLPLRTYSPFDKPFIGPLNERRRTRCNTPAMVGRREFLKTGAAVGGGLLVSWHMLSPAQVQAKLGLRKTKSR